MKEILEQLEEQESGKGSKKPKAKSRNSDGMAKDDGQLDLLSFTANSVMQDEIISELKEIDVQSLTPIEALNVLYRLHQKAEKRI